MQFYLEEAKGNVDYQGYIFPRSYGEHLGSGPISGDLSCIFASSPIIPLFDQQHNPASWLESSPLSTLLSDRSCWCLFRVSVLKQRPAGTNHVHRDSYGRFAADSKGVDNTSLGWNDFMRMSEFLEHEAGYLVDDTAMFSTSFHVIKESSSFFKNPGLMLGGRAAARKLDGHFGKFTWRIENSIRLKDLLKKRKITGLCAKLATRTVAS